MTADPDRPVATRLQKPTRAQVHAAQLLLRLADQGEGVRTRRLERLASGEPYPVPVPATERDASGV